jgi:hypothetical protein
MDRRGFWHPVPELFLFALERFLSCPFFVLFPSLLPFLWTMALFPCLYSVITPGLNWTMRGYGWD